MSGPGNAGEEFTEKLSDLEAAVEVTVLPGEVPAWARRVQEEMRGFSEILRARKREHEDAYEQILRNDMELARRVEQLRARDRETDGKLHELRARLDELAVAGSGGDGEGSREPVKGAVGLRKDLLGWIVRCRAHEKDVETWLVEAFYRDRGTQD